MIEEVFSNVFRVEIPLPESPLKAINAYIVKGNERDLMIDTGMNRPECREAMGTALKLLGVDPIRTDFFVTHCHADHFGLAAHLAGDSSKVYCHDHDANIVRTPDVRDRIVAAAVTNGFPEEEIVTAMREIPARQFQMQIPANLICLHEGDRLSVGGFDFQCVETPGHSPGHLCLYDPRTRIFFSGDHLLEDISPTIIVWDEGENALGQYLDSLNKIHSFEISLVLPGHRRVFTDHRKRIAELIRHHESRLEEILTLLSQGPQSAYQIAAQVSWDIDCDTWEDFPLFLRWMATGEACSHLLYHTAQKNVRRKDIAGGALFSL